MRATSLGFLVSDETLHATLEVLRSRSSRYAWYGVIIASCAVVLACLLVAQHFYGGLSYANLLLAQRENIAIWVLEAMPFVFATWGQVVSRRTAEDAGSAIRARTRSLRHNLRRERFTARVRTDYFAKLSHEFRTPLSAVLGLSETLLEKAADLQLRKDLQVIHGAAENLLALVNDILDFSAIEAGHIELDRVEFDLPECVRNTCQLLRSQARHKGLALELRINPNVPKLVVGDPGRVRQVLVNLIGNAVKFTERGAVRCEVRAEQGGSALAHRAVIAIHDSGPGMDERTMARLFRPYTRANSRGSSRPEGTGLGLAIANELVDAMGGDISVESAVGKGSTFTVRLPLERQQGVSLAVLARNIELRGMRLLLADKPREERNRFETQLRTLGLDVMVVDDGIDALREALRGYVQGRPFEMLVANLFTEHLLAEDLGNELKRRPETRDICLVSITAAGTRGDARRVKEAGFSGYFTLPVPPQHLAELLQATLATSALPVEQRDSRGLVTRHYIRENTASELAVLLVEDDAVSLAVTQKRLTNLGCTVTCAASGAEALELAARSVFQLVLLDYNLPDLRGDQVAARLLATLPEPMPIVMFSAGLTQTEKQRCRKSGAAGFLEKPATREGLLAILQRHCHAALDTVSDDEQPPAAVTPALRRVFIRESLMRIAALEQAVGQKLDKETVHRVAHTMRSSARHVGARNLALLFDALEAAVKDGSEKAVRLKSNEALGQWRNTLEEMENEDADRTVTLVQPPG